MPDSFDQAHDRLVGSAEALVFATKWLAYILGGEIGECPAKASFTLTCFRGVKEKLAEVQRAIEDVEAAASLRLGSVG